MVDLTEISAIVAAAGVLVGVVYYVLDMRHQSKVRQTDLIMRLHSETCTKEFIEAYQKASNIKFNDYDDFVNKYGPLYSEGPEQTAILMCAMFMEGLGVLLHRKLVDVGPLRELFPIEAGWRKFEPLIIGARKQYGSSSSYEWFEYLYNETKKREQRK